MCSWMVASVPVRRGHKGVRSYATVNVVRSRGRRIPRALTNAVLVHERDQVSL